MHKNNTKHLKKLLQKKYSDFNHANMIPGEEVHSLLLIIQISLKRFPSKETLKLFKWVSELWIIKLVKNKNIKNKLYLQ